MGPFHSLKKRKRHAYVLLDIGSAGVGGAVVRAANGGKAEVLYGVRKNIPPQKTPDFKKLFSHVQTTLREVLSDIRKNSSVPVREARCSLASPWYTVEVRPIHIRQNKTFTVTPQIIEMLTESELKDYLSALPKNPKTGEMDTEIIESQTVQVKLNGYETEQPYGKEVTNMDAYVLIALSSKKILEGLNEVFAKVFPGTPLAYHSFALLGFLAVRNIFYGVSDFLFLDITGEVTDVCVVRQNTLRAIHSFSTGKNTLIRMMRKENPSIKTTDDAIAAMRAYLAKHEKDRKGDSIHSAVSKFRERWEKGFLEARRMTARKIPTPNRIFYTSHDVLSGILSESMSRNELESNTSLTKNVFDVTFLDADILSAFCSASGTRAKDPFLLLEAIAIGALDASRREMER